MNGADALAAAEASAVALNTILKSCNNTISLLCASALSDNGTGLLTYTGTGGFLLSGTGAQLSVQQGTITTSFPFITHIATWNNAATAFTDFSTSLSCTAAAAASSLINLQVGGASYLNLNFSGATCTTAQLDLSNGAANPSVRVKLSSGNFIVTSGGAYSFTSSSTSAAGTVDSGIDRLGAKYLGVCGNSTCSDSTGFVKTAQTLEVITADVTCGTGGTLAPCTSATTITGLSVALPLVAANWSFDCDLMVSQATAAAANQILVQTATNGATNLTAGGEAYTAAGTATAGGFTDAASTTTAQSIITFTPGATGTKLPLRVWGTIEGTSASGTVFNLQVLTGAAADLLTIYRGSKCWLH